MKMTIEELKSLGYEITSTCRQRKSSKRKVATKDGHNMLECTNCGNDTFHDLDSFNSNKRAYLGRSNFCIPCIKKKQSSGGGNSVSIGIKRFEFSNDEKLSFKLEPVENGTIILVTVGNSFEWNKANNKVYSHVSYARNDINRISSEMGTDMERIH